MTIEHQFIQLLEKNREKEIIPFLQGLSTEDRKALTPLAKKLGKEYFEYKQVGNTWKDKATDQQRRILHYTFFTCYNEKDFKRENLTWLLSREHLEQFLPWYCPPWLDSYVNSFSESEWLPYDLSYFYLVELTERGFIQPSPQLVARLLVPAIFELKDRKHFFVPEKVLQYAITVEEHIWYLFQYETNVHTANRWMYGLEEKEQKGWDTVFKQLIDEGKLSRERVLNESLLASNRNFNKNLSGWFADLFLQLQPAKDETLILQPELFNLFSSPHSKVVNTALQGCKMILEDKGFDAGDFLDHVPALLASDTKSVVTTTVQLLEKLAKSYPDKQAIICRLVTAAFIHRDEALQTRAAKLISKYAPEDDEEIKQLLLPYGSNLFSTARTLLQAFMTVEQKPTEQPLSHSTPGVQKGALPADTLLPIIHDVDELVFLASQAFDNNQSWHIDLLPDALLRLNKQIRGEDLVKFEPAIQRALKFYFGDWHSSRGALDQMLACLFLDHVLWLIGRYPEQTTSTRDLFKSFMYKSEENKKTWDEHGINVSFLAGWKSYGEKEIYNPYQKLFHSIAAALKAHQDLPLLCTPTHTPAWIDPCVLVERLYLRQQQMVYTDDMDLQIALSRCWLHETEAAIQLAREKLTGEAQALMLFLLDKEQLPNGPFTNEDAWMLAALAKSPQTVYPELAELSYSLKPREIYTGQYKWQTLIEAYQVNDYSWEGGKMITKPVTRHRKVIRLQEGVPADTPKISGLKKFFSQLVGNKKVPADLPPLLYDYMMLKGQWLSTEDRDIRRIYFLTPSHPEPLLAATLQKCMDEATFTSETHKRFVTEVLQALHETHFPSGEMAHLFLATCMITSDKTITNYAAEIWLQGVLNQTVDSRLIGKTLGIHERIEFAPLKRFTELVVSNLMGISSAHNKELEILLAALIKELPVEPIKGLKKLLEIYMEVVRLNGSEMDEGMKKTLAQWKEKGSLGKVLKSNM